MKKNLFFKISSVLSLSLCLAFNPWMMKSYGFGPRSTQVWNKPESVADALLQIHKDIEEIFKLNLRDIHKNENSKPIRRDILQNALDKDLFHEPLDGMYLVYGDPQGDDDRLRPSSRTYQGNPPPEISEKRFLGFDHSDALFDNPAYPWLGWGGSPIKDYNFVPRPWEVNILKENFNLHPEGSNFTTVLAPTADSRRRLNESIKEGLFSKYVNYKAKETVIGLDRSNIEKSLYWGQVVDPLSLDSKISEPSFYIELSDNQFTRISNHNQSMDWLDFVYILSPPTTFSWGTGYLFFEKTGLSSGQVNPNSFSYMTVPIVPANKTPDYSITILRTGTENGLFTEDGMFESIIEVSKHHFNEDESTTPQILISFENAIISSVNEVKGLYEDPYVAGGVGYSLEQFLAWEKNGAKELIEEIPRTQFVDAWLSSISPEHLAVGRDQYYRGMPREINRSIHPHANAPLFFSMEKGKLSRYYKILWMPIAYAPHVSIEAKVNLNENGIPLLDEIETRNNWDKVSIPLSFSDFSTKIITTGAERNNNLATFQVPHRAHVEYMAKVPQFSSPPQNIPIQFFVDDIPYLNEEISFSQDDKIEDPLTPNFSIYKMVKTLQWTPKSPVLSTLHSTINLNKNQKAIFPEQILENNSHILEIPVEISPDSSATNHQAYQLGYDVLTQDFSYIPHQGSPFIAFLPPPNLGGRQYSSWSLSSTLGNFYLNVQDPKRLLSNILKKDTGSINESHTTVLRYPALFFTISRESLGDRVSSKNYLSNLTNPKETFSLDTLGSYIQRNYRVWSYTYSQNEDGSMLRVRTPSISQTSRQEFSPIEDLSNSPIPISALVYNGIPLLNKSIFQGEEETGQNLTKKLVWEGQRIQIPVLRGLRNLDLDGNTKNISWIDGQFERTFQHQDTAHVKFHVSQSLANHFSVDRNASYNNPGNRTQHHYLFSPFATDSKLQSFPYPHRAGYYYIPHAQYTAEIETTIYKRSGEQTEHNRIVDEVIKSFTIEHNIPLLDIHKNKISSLPFNAIKNYTKLEDTTLPYDLLPTNLETYLKGSEKDLLGNTDPLLGEILEGWSFSKDPDGRNSWQNYRYREFIKNSDIRKIVEKTTVTFQLNPRYLDRNNVFYSDVNALSGDYGIAVYLKPFTNSIQESLVRTKENVILDTIALNIRGNMYMDIDGN
jgi:hypothetical protein